MRGDLARFIRHTMLSRSSMCCRQGNWQRWHTSSTPIIASWPDQSQRYVDRHISHRQPAQRRNRSGRAEYECHVWPRRNNGYCRFRNRVLTKPGFSRLFDLCVLKVGGNELKDAHFLSGLAAAMAAFDEPVVIVHGGGQAIADFANGAWVAD